MVAEYVGQEARVAVLEVVRDSRKVVCSVAKARENDDLRQLEVRLLLSKRKGRPLPASLIALQVGSLISGTVRRIEPFGVFVGINNTRISGLLHISNVSRQHIDSVHVSDMLVVCQLDFELAGGKNCCLAGNV